MGLIRWRSLTVNITQMMLPAPCTSVGRPNQHVVQSIISDCCHFNLDHVSLVPQLYVAVELCLLSCCVQVRVVRGGSEVTVSCFDLLVGDVLLVECGDILPADGLLVQGDYIK